MSADNRDPFALARSEADDAGLFALIEEYRHLDNRAGDLFEEADRRRKELALSVGRDRQDHPARWLVRPGLR